MLRTRLGRRLAWGAIALAIVILAGVALIGAVGDPKDWGL
jgi:hypothetical protein